MVRPPFWRFLCCAIIRVKGGDEVSSIGVGNAISSFQSHCREELEKSSVDPKTKQLLVFIVKEISNLAEELSKEME